jgi:hypothetical protein
LKVFDTEVYAIRHTLDMPIQITETLQ